MSNAILTIAIPTHNRAPYLRLCIESLMQQSDQSDLWNVLVVNNNSTDDTDLVLSRTCTHDQRFTHVDERQPGLSAARNAAIGACTARYVLFVDDECTFPQNYVRMALSIIEARAPVMFGGPVLGRLLPDAPNWFRPEYGSFSLPGGTARSQRIFLSGGNIGFCLKDLQRIGGFDTKLGMSGKAIGFGEETDVELRILEAFGPDAVWFDPAFYNFHAVRPEKYRWSFLLREHFSRGVARARLNKIAGDRLDLPIPDCLRTRPDEGGSQHPVTSRGWQNIVYENVLPLVRYLGYFWHSAIHHLARRV